MPALLIYSGILQMRLAPDFLPALTWVAVFASLDFDIDPA
jgi:hypothetical protein